jgi:hypothetical protein
VAVLLRATATRLGHLQRVERRVTAREHRDGDRNEHDDGGRERGGKAHGGLDPVPPRGLGIGAQRCATSATPAHAALCTSGACDAAASWVLRPSRDASTDVRWRSRFAGSGPSRRRRAGPVPALPDRSQRRAP